MSQTQNSIGNTAPSMYQSKLLHHNDAVSRIMRKRMARSRGWRLHLKCKTIKPNRLHKLLKMMSKYLASMESLAFMHSQWTHSSHQGCFGYLWAKIGSQLGDGMMNFSVKDTYVSLSNGQWSTIISKTGFLTRGSKRRYDIYHFIYTLSHLCKDQ